MMRPRVPSRCCHRRLVIRVYVRIQGRMQSDSFGRVTSHSCVSCARHGANASVAGVQLSDDGSLPSCVISAAVSRVRCIDGSGKRDCAVMGSLTQRYDRRVVTRMAGPAVHEACALRDSL